MVFSPFVSANCIPPKRHDYHYIACEVVSEKNIKSIIAVRDFDKKTCQKETLKTPTIDGDFCI